MGNLHNPKEKYHMISMWLPGKSNQMIVTRLDWKMSLSIKRIYLHVKYFILHDSCLSATHGTKISKGISLWCHMLCDVTCWASFISMIQCPACLLTSLCLSKDQSLTCPELYVIFSLILFNKFYKYEELFFLAKKMNRYVNLHKYTAVLEIHLIYV